MQPKSTFKNANSRPRKRPENTPVFQSDSTGKEKDAETGYHYFGARYYNSDLSLWLSVDPMADKYPSLSPYNYCAWNPMKIVDPDGNKIWIVGNDGNNYQYKRGKMYTVNGDIYRGNDSYVTRVCSDLSELKKWGGRKEIRRMEHSKLDITIRNGNDNSHCSLDDVGEITPSIGSGSVITYNTEKTETKDGERAPVYGLAHELGHAYDAMRGKINNEKVSIFKKEENYTDKVIPISEINAVRFENKVRPTEKQRTTYDGYDLTPFNVIMKDENGMGL